MTGKFNIFRPAMLCCLALMAITWAAPARASGNENLYACKCEGAELYGKASRGKVLTKLDLCGNGYKGGDKGMLKTGLDWDRLQDYLPNEVRASISDYTCAFSQTSG